MMEGACTPIHHASIVTSVETTSQGIRTNTVACTCSSFVLRDCLHMRRFHTRELPLGPPFTHRVSSPPSPSLSPPHPAALSDRYHDGGSGLWSDRKNVFNNIGTSSVFCHGSSPGISVDYVWYNNSEKPNMQGDTNHELRDPVTGNCKNATIIDIGGGDWPAEAQAIINGAGRRTEFPRPQPPPLSPPQPKPAPPPSGNASCWHPPAPAPGPKGFAAEICSSTKLSQRWILSPGVTPSTFAKPTNLKSAAAAGAGCAEITGCSSSEGAGVGCSYGCKPLPPPGDSPLKNKCEFNGVWELQVRPFYFL